ncbi:MAG: pyridoxal-dependent decarboxylase [Caulobacteraceae bacterium]
MSPALKPLTRGLERAHSVAFDFHKWAHAPYDAGFLLVRDADLHKRTFAAPAAYLSRAPRGLAAGDDWPCDYGPDLSRGFRALKVWLTFQTLGADAIAGAIEANCAAAKRLAGRIAASRLFELAAPGSAQHRLLLAGGRNRRRAQSRTGDTPPGNAALAAPSTTRIDGREVVRAAILQPPHQLRRHRRLLRRRR